MGYVQKKIYKSRREDSTKETVAWVGRYTAPDGRERSRRFAKKSDADKWLKANQGDVVRGQWIDPKAGRVPFVEWAEEWRDTRVGLRASTKARDFGYLDRYILPTFGKMDLSAIDPMTVERWLAELTGPGPRPWRRGVERRRLSPATAVKAQQILSKILARAVRAKKIAANPCDDLELPRIEREEMRFLTVKEVDLLAECINPRHRALVLVGAWGGLRISELAGLRRGRVDILRNRVDVAEIVVEIGGHLTYGRPKTKAGRRSVTLPASVAVTLSDHLAEFTPPDPDAFVFTAPEGGPLRVPAWRRRQWRPAVELAGLQPLRPHDLRHTAVALWIAAGASPLEVSRRAGHTSVSFTLDRYGHLFPEADATVADKLEELRRAL
jgi:integrase